MMSSSVCPVCDGTDHESLVDFGTVPRSGGFIAAATDPVPVRRLRFHFCTGCGLVRQDDDAAGLADYTHVNRGTERQLPAYTCDILDRLAAAPGARDGLVIEIGSNDGTFLSQLEAHGFVNRVGVEPSKALADQSQARGHRVVNTHLDATTAPDIRAAYGPACAVVCRHTLEHVPSPAALLASMAMLLEPGGQLLVEVPDSSTILADLHFHELWDEHLTYFCDHHLYALAVRTGFLVGAVDAREHQGSRNLLCWAIAPGGATSSTAPVPTAGAMDRTVSLCRKFKPRWQDFTKQLREKVAACEHPVVATGASHPQSNFLVFAGIGGQVDLLIDDDPRKVGCLVPIPQPTPVVPATAIDALAGRGTLLLTGFGYPAWMAKMRDLGVRKGWQVVDLIEGLE